MYLMLSVERKGEFVCYVIKNTFISTYWLPVYSQRPLTLVVPIIIKGNACPRFDDNTSPQCVTVGKLLRLVQRSFMSMSSVR